MTAITTEAVVSAYLAAGSFAGAAKALGMPEATVRFRVSKVSGPVREKSSEARFATVRAWAAERGLLGFEPVLPGYAVKRTTTRYDGEGEVTATYVTQAKAPGARQEIPAGHVVKGVSILRDGEGRTVQEWVKTREGQDPLDVVAAIKEAFDGYQGRAVPAPAPAATSEDLLTLLPLADWHVGMFSWHRETGTNWDTDIAEEVLGRHVEQAVDRSPPSAHGVVLGGGDLMHADNQENRTARSGNQLDVDGRYPRVLKVACRLMVRTVDAMLRRHARVTVRVLPGNHDEHASVAVSYFLMAWYRDEPRVTVDVGPGLFWWHRHGRVMLGATHGHTVKAKDMPSVMAHRRAADWGVTEHRYVHTFHLHHKVQIATEGNGCIAEVHQAPIPQDAWHYGAGFLSGRSIQAITYHQAFGEVSRARVAIIDAQPEGTA